MEIMTVQQGAARRGREPMTAVTYTGAAAFCTAAIWYALAVQGVAVARQPTFTRHQSSAQRFRIFYDWVVSTLPQERWYVSLAILGFLSLATVGMLMRRPTSHDQMSAAGALTLAMGSTLWIVGNLFQLGGHHAVGLMATHGNPLRVVSSIFFTVEMIDDAFETAAFATIGLALLLLARVGAQSGQRAWSRYSAGLGTACLALAVAYILDEGDIVNLLLVALGAVAIPVWMIWTGRAQHHAAADFEAR